MAHGYFPPGHFRGLDWSGLGPVRLLATIAKCFRHARVFFVFGVHIRPSQLAERGTLPVPGAVSGRSWMERAGARTPAGAGTSTPHSRVSLCIGCRSGFLGRHGGVRQKCNLRP